MQPRRIGPETDAVLPLGGLPAAPSRRFSGTRIGPAEALASTVTSELRRVRRRLFRHAGKAASAAAGSARVSLVIAAVASTLVVAVCVFTLQRIGFEREQALKEAISHNNNLALTLEEHALRTVDGADQMLLALRRSYRAQGPGVDIAQLIVSASFDPTLFNTAGIANANGDIVNSLRGGRGNVADREYFAELRRDPGRGMVVTKPLVGRLTGLPSLFISRALNEPGEPFAGVAMVGIPPRYFQNIYDQVDVGRHGVVALVGTDDGIVRASPSNSGFRIGQDLRESLLLARLREAPAGSFTGAGRLDGVTRLLSYRTVKGLPLVIVVGTACDEVLAGFEQRARYYVVGAAMRIALIVMLAIAIGVAFQRQRRAHERMRWMSSRLIEIQEGERRVLARELHDDVGQELTGIRLLLSSVATSLPSGPAGQDIAYCQQAVDAALAKVRDLSLGLRPSQLDELGLVAALRWHIDRVQRTATASILFVQEVGAARFAADIEIAAFRVAQEALNNAVKHAGARRIEVALHLHRELELAVRDDGVGFVPGDVARSATARGSMGLLDMQERTHLVGGRSELIASPGKGCTIRCSFPLEPTPQRTSSQTMKAVTT